MSRVMVVTGGSRGIGAATVLLAARKGYAATDEAVENSASETLWCSPACVPEKNLQIGLFAETEAAA